MDAMAVRETMQGYLDELASEGDFARYLAEDVALVLMETHEVTRGRDAVRDAVVNLHTDTFAGRFVCTRLVCDDDSAAIEAQLIGSHVGELAGIAPTGTPVTITYSVHYDLADGLITELRGYLPLTATVLQLHAADESRAAG
ncbi:ester cyclase [Cellulomonas sp. ATA003]|uniref:ester cyclase n=1 Tax=Cellulomonas sp. ATA003 TaxID=3073064 RepID=UPI002872F431|nr:ester cyclase [Cellulomonas sp. ATA003]WNB84660.1 ester cyclase [Cellulomonas sp. ATA003]